MAKSKSANVRTKKVEPMERIANLLALLLVKDSKASESILQLVRAGFADEEISALLNTSQGNIRQTRYLANKKKPD